MTERYEIRLAEETDLINICGLIGEAAGWLQATKNTDQWARPWPNRQARDTRLRQAVEDRLTWMLYVRGRLAGTITIREQGSSELWEVAELLDPAVYVSRLIVGRRYAGRKIGAALLDWAGLQGIRRWQANWIRVDVWTENFDLHDYYRNHGFTYLRTRHYDDPWEYPSAALFQKPTAAIDMMAAMSFEELARSSSTTAEIRSAVPTTL
jgi:GNAT superfamily N-acetyltransferase